MTWHRLPLLWVLTGLTGLVSSAWAGDWAFEGVITGVSGDWDASLRPDQVISGSFFVPDDADLLAGAVDSGIVRGYLAIDQNYILIVASQQPTDAAGGWDLLDIGPQRYARLYFPLENVWESGDAAGTVYLSLLLPVDATQDLPPLADILARGVGQVQLTRQGDGGTWSVTAPLNYLGPPPPPMTPEEEAAHYRDLLADVGSRLNATQARLEETEQALQRAQDRVRGLNQTLDVFIAERAQLQSDLERALQAPAATDEMRERLAQVEADLILAEESRQRLAEDNLTLTRVIAETERERSTLQEELAALKDLLAATKAPTPARSVPVLEPALRAPAAPPPVVEPSSVAEEADAQSFRSGPSKVRRYRR